jgi:hypothetical protein
MVPPRLRRTDGVATGKRAVDMWTAAEEKISIKTDRHPKGYEKDPQGTKPTRGGWRRRIDRHRRPNDSKRVKAHSVPKRPQAAGDSEESRIGIPKAIRVTRANARTHSRPKLPPTAGDGEKKTYRYGGATYEVVGDEPAERLENIPTTQGKRKRDATDDGISGFIGHGEKRDEKQDEKRLKTKA